MISLEQGRFYKTRNCKNAYCIGECPFYKTTKDSFVCSVEGNIHRYFPNGNWMSFEQDEDEKYDLDIIGDKNDG